MPTLLLIGLGGLGSTFLELLAREQGLGRIVVASRNEARGIARCNLARLGAMAQGHDPSISFVRLDVNSEQQLMDLVGRESPDLILSAASMQTWWLPDLLPPAQQAVIKSAGFGVWLPVHMALTLKLMKGLRRADYGGVTLTAPFPDVVNCVLGRLGIAPTSGVGNLDEIVPKVRMLAAERLRVHPETVCVLLVAHHALEAAVYGQAAGEVPPYFLRVEHDGRDVTETVRADELLLAPFPITPGQATHFLTAGSTVRLVRALLSPQVSLLHAPGPLGLPGGYPVLVGGGALRLAPAAGITPEEAIDINERSHRFDGIERIEDDGTVVFCPEAAQVLRLELGYECDRLRPADCAEQATELITRFRAYARRHGVEL